MNYFSIDYLIVYASLLATLYIGLREGRDIKDLRDYAIANKVYGTSALLLTFLATNLGGGSTLEVVSCIFSDGVIMAVSLFGVAISLLFIAIFIAPKMQYFDHCITVGDVMGSLYGKGSKVITGILGTLYSLCMVGMELLMLGVVCELLLGIPAIWGVCIGGLLLAAYAAHGGIKSVTMTDIFQFLILFAMLPFLAVLTISKVGSIKEVFMQVPAEKFNILKHEKFSYYLTLLLVWSIFPVGITSPPIFQRLLMAKRPDQLRNQYFIAAAFDPCFQLTMMMLGLCGIVLYPTIEAKLVLPHIITHILPVGIKGLAIAGMLAIVMSTADSYLHAAGLLFTHDVVKPLCDRLKVTINELPVAKYSTILIGCGAIVIGLNATSALALSFKAVGFTGPMLMFPLIAGILGLKPEKSTFYIAMGVTIGVFISSHLFLPKEQIHLATLASIIANGISFFGAHVIQHKGFAIILRNGEGATEHIWRPKKKPLLEQLQRYAPTLQNILQYSQLSVQKYGAPYVLFGVFCCFNFTLPYFMYAHESKQIYELTLYIRLIGALACGLLVVKEKWASYLLPYLPTFWHLTLLYCIPFTSTVMFLLTQGSTEWLINVTLTIMFLIVLVDWMSFFILTGLGIALGFLFYTQVVGPIDLKLDFTTGYLLVYQGIFATLIGLLFARRRQQKFDRAVIRRQQLATAHQATSGRLVEALNYQDNLAKGLSKEGTHLLKDMYAASKELKEAIKPTPNKKLQEAIEKLESGIDYLKEISYRTKDYLRLEVSKVSLDTLLREVQLAIKTQDLEPTPSLAIQLITQQKELQGDMERIKTLLINGICYAQQYNIDNHPIQLAVESTQLGYKLSSIKDYTKKIDALRFTITTDDTLPTLQPIYMGDISTAQVPPETLLDLPKTENARIVDAHYGVVAYYEMEENLSIVYVIPLRIRDIRPKNMDLKEMQKGPEEVIVDYAGAAALEHELLESIKDKAQGVSIAKVEKAIGIIKKYHGSQKRKSGEPFYFHPITVAQLVLDFAQDEETIIAALLHDIVEDTSMSLVQVEAMFGPGVARLVDGVTKLDKGTRRLSLSSFENTKKLLDEEEKRILKIKLADRIHNMRTIEGHASYEKQKQVSEETLQFFIPLAKQLGLSQAVEELKSLVFDVLNRG